MKNKAIIAGFVAGALLVGVVGCAPKAAAPADEPEAPEETVAVEFSMDSDCGTCHETEMQSSSDAACAMSMHSDMSCVDCHADASSMEKAHEGATMEEASEAKLAKTKVDIAACEGCHDIETLKEATADVTVLTDENGTTVNPHDLPATHLGDYIVCTDCHSLHSDKSTEENATAMCAGCHHKNVYECNTCH